MTRLLRPLVLATLWATQLSAAEPKAVIKGKASVPAGYPVLLDGRESVADPDKPLVWKWKGSGPEPLSLTFDKDGRSNVVLMVPDPPSGLLRFILVAKAGGDADADLFDVVVGSGPGPVPPGPQPPGPVPPGPVPPGPQPPTPPPVTGRLCVSYVVDATAQTAAQAALRTNGVLRSTLKDLDAVWVTYQSDEEDLDKRRLRSKVASVGLPCVVIQTWDGVIVDAFKVTQGVQILDAVKRLRGAK